MDRNTVIGFLLIFGLLLVWQQLVGPGQAETLEAQRVQDSIARAQPGPDIQGQDLSALPVYTPDTSAAGQTAATGRFGAFAPRANLSAENYTLENDLLRLTFSSQGGRIVAAEVKSYEKISAGEADEKVTAPVVLMNDARNEWSLTVPATGAAGGSVNTAELPFEVQQVGNTITFTLPARSGGALVQRYTLGEDYTVDYELIGDGLGAAIGSPQAFDLHWVNYLDKVEKNVAYEQQNSLLYWKEFDEKVDYLDASGEDAETAEEPVHWVSHAQQFFNTSLVAPATAPLSAVRMASVEQDEDAQDLKALTTDAKLAFGTAAAPARYQLYIGPNEFDRLRATADDLEDIVPFGWSLFGTVNRWLIRPLFSFLSSFIGQAGLVIMALTFIVKLVLYPLTYKMLRSQAKMRALKPRLAKMKEKHKDDQQGQQMEQMKLYREYGVNPAGGCLPMVFQMPILFALYRFFPASIEFRQKSFLWATDLSSYDEWIHFGTSLPLLGDHLSLFTLLWVLTTIAYTYYNSQAMDMGQMANNPAFKYIQYLMPIMFLFFFNSFASGLTVYLVFANLFNITQTLVTKNLIIDDAKIERELQAAKAKPKKEGGFASRLQTALEEQQKVAAQKGKK